MFHEMRRKDRQLSQAETGEILAKGVYGVLSVKDENGYAYGVPLNYVCVGKTIYFHSALEGHKMSCLRADNRVSFCVVPEAVPLPEAFSTAYRSAVVFGKAREVSGEEKLAALHALLEKYSGPFMEKGKKHVAAAFDRTAVIGIDAEHISGKGRKHE